MDQPAPAPGPAPDPGKPWATIDPGAAQGSLLDMICAALESGASLKQTAAVAGMTPWAMWEWQRADPGRSARVHLSAQAGAEAHESLALAELHQCRAEVRALTPEESGKASALVSLAREIAQAHWRMAAVRDPQRYGMVRSRVELAGPDGQPLAREVLGPAVAELVKDLRRIEGGPGPVKGSSRAGQVQDVIDVTVLPAPDVELP